MSDVINGKPTTMFWVIGAAALVWNLIGLVFYYGQVTMSAEALARLTEAQQQFFVTMPKWATSAHAVAVNAGVLGSVFLLLRKAWAVPVFIVSLLGVIIQDIHAFVLSGAMDLFGVNGLIVPTIVFVVAVLLIFYSRSARKKGWIA